MRVAIGEAANSKDSQHKRPPVMEDAAGAGNGNNHDSEFLTVDDALRWLDAKVDYPSWGRKSHEWQWKAAGKQDEMEETGDSSWWNSSGLFKSRSEKLGRNSPTANQAHQETSTTCPSAMDVDSTAESSMSLWNGGDKQGGLHGWAENTRSENRRVTRTTSEVGPSARMIGGAGGGVAAMFGSLSRKFSVGKDEEEVIEKMLAHWVSKD